MKLKIIKKNKKYIGIALSLIIISLISYILLYSSQAQSTAQITLNYEDGTSRTLTNLKIASLSSLSIASISSSNSLPIGTCVKLSGNKFKITDIQNNVYYRSKWTGTSYSATDYTRGTTLQYLQENYDLIACPDTVATLTVSPTPSGATVDIGLGYTSTTPYTYYDLHPDTYTIKITKPGYNMTGTLLGGKTMSTSPTLQEQISPTSTPVITPSPTPTPIPSTRGTLLVTSNPSYSSLLIKKTSTGTILATSAYTPDNGYSISLLPDTYTITLSSSGYNTYSSTATVSTGQTTTVNAVLTRTITSPASPASPIYTSTPTLAPIPGKGTLSITSSPVGSYIYLSYSSGGIISSGELITPYNIQLSPGTYYLTLKKTDYSDYTTGTITINSDQTTSINADLQASVQSLQTQNTPAPLPGLYDTTNNRKITSVSVKLYVNPTLSLTPPINSKLLLKESTSESIGGIISETRGNVIGSINGLTTVLINKELQPNADNLIAEKTFSEYELNNIVTSPNELHTLTIYTYKKKVEYINPSGEVESTMEIPYKSIGTFSIIRRN